MVEHRHVQEGDAWERQQKVIIGAKRHGYGA